MIERLVNINPGAVDFGGVMGGGGLSYTPQEILLGSIGCKNHYTALLIAMHTYTSSNIDIEYVFNQDQENEIIHDCKKDYKRIAKMLVRSKGKRKPLHDDEIMLLACCAINAKVENKTQDIDFAEYLGVTVSQFKSKYRQALDNCFIRIEQELQSVERSIYKRLGK